MVSYDSARHWIVYSDVSSGSILKVWDVKANAEVKAPYQFEFLRQTAATIAAAKDFKAPAVPRWRRVINRLAYWVRGW